MTVYSDPEKQPDTLAHFVIHKGIRLESRYRKRAEFAAMAAMLDHLERMTATPICELIDRMFCNSKASATYEVYFLERGALAADFSCSHLAYGAMISPQKGHNGIVAYRACNDEFLAEESATWLGDDDEVVIGSEPWPF